MKIYSLIVFLFIGGLFNVKAQTSKETIIALMDKWHKDAAEVNFEGYFGALHPESIYIGTDATERWTKPEFIAFAKPYFDKGQAWNFKAMERFVNFSADKKTAWVDELLNTQMKICRGSAVLVQEKGKWYIKHYVLSMTVPNDVIDQVLPIKASIEDAIIDSLTRKK